MRIETFCITGVFLAALGSNGCDHSTKQHMALESTPSAIQLPSTNPASVRVADRFDVAEAVFRYQIARSGQKNHVEYFFLSLDDADPPPEFLARFKEENPGVLAASMSTASVETGVRHKDVGGRGIVFYIRAITRLDNDTAEVQGGYYYSNVSASGNTYQVEKRNGKWTVVKDVVKFIS